MKTKGLLLLASLAMMIMFTGVAAAEGPVKDVYPQGTSEQSGTADWASLDDVKARGGEAEIYESREDVPTDVLEGDPHSASASPDDLPSAVSRSQMPMAGSLTSTAGDCTYRTRSDDIHFSGSQLSVHGWWETVSSTGCPSKADVNVQLQGLMCQSFGRIEVCWWETIEPHGEEEANLWPGGGRGKRVTGRSDCASNTGTGFRSVVDVDLVGIWDPSQKLRSAGEEFQCRPPEPYS